MALNAMSSQGMERSSNSSTSRLSSPAAEAQIDQPGAVDHVDLRNVGQVEQGIQPLDLHVGLGFFPGFAQAPSLAVSPFSRNPAGSVQ
jgi:hypothetical protein